MIASLKEKKVLIVFDTTYKFTRIKDDKTHENEDECLDYACISDLKYLNTK